MRPEGSFHSLSLAEGYVVVRFNAAEVLNQRIFPETGWSKGR